MDLDQLKADWERMGGDDPLWAVYSERRMKDGGWDVVDFFDTGREEVSGVMSVVDGLFPHSRRERVLDFGCGVGRLTQPLANYFSESIGVDIAHNMIEHAQEFNQIGERCSFILNQEANLKIFANETFDGVYSSIVMQHIPVDYGRLYLREFARILRPGGFLTFTMPSKPAMTIKGGLYRVLPFSLINAYKRRRDGSVMAMHHIARHRLEAYLSDLGLSVASTVLDDSAGPNWVAYRYFAYKPE